MNRLLKRILILAPLVAGSLVAASGSVASDYPRALNFQNVVQNADIALGEVEAIVQDHQGFIWLGGRNALLRYDGYDFVPILVQEGVGDASKQTAVNQVVDLLVDSRKDLWVATRSGLLRYDRNNQILQRLAQQNGEALAAYTETVNRIVEAPGGEIVAGAYAGLTIIDPQTLNAKAMLHEPGNAASLANNTVHDLFVDDSGNVWVGTDAGVSRIEWLSKTITNFVPDPSQPNSLPDNAVWAIDQDKEGNIWLGVHAGVYRFNQETQALTRYKHDAGNRFSLAGDIIRDIFVDSNGWVWIGSDSGGLSLYDRQNDRFLRFGSEVGKLGSLSSSIIRRIYEDKTGDLWVGTYPSGANFHDRASTAIASYKHDPGVPESILSNEVSAVLEDAKGDLWIGGGGVSRIDRSTDSVTRYAPGPAGKQSIASGAIISGYIDSDGDIWFGTWASGFHRYNREVDRFDQIPFDATLAKTGRKSSTVLNDSVVWDIYEDRQKNLWIATHSGGLSRFDKKSGVFTIYEQDASNPDSSLANQLVWTTFEDSKGRFWVGTASGLNLMDREKGKFKVYRPNPEKPGSMVNGSVLSIFEDSKGRVWFGTDGGLHLYHGETDSFTVFNAETGFGDSGIRSIVEDKNGNLWLGTNNGAVMFNPDSKVVKNYKSASGEKLGGFFTGSVALSSRGEVMLGSSKSGLWIFDVDKLAPNSVVPPVVMTDFRIFTKPVAINGPDEILSRAINETSEIVLDYKKTMISFGFAALNFRDTEKNQYAYKLEGFDEDWREVGNQRTALYTNLDAGLYTFRVRGSNNDGVWNEEGRSITIRQLPPPWRTWWAHTIYGLILLAIVARFFQVQRNKRRLIEEQNRILEQRVAERTAELREKNNDIQAMLSNMRQGLFTVEPNGQIHPEYARHLEEVFETTDIAGRNAVELLFANAHLGGDALDQAKEAVGSIIGEDEMNFDFNSHLLPQEYQIEIGGNQKFLALDWNPIVVDDRVSKLMVSVRDVTQLKQMESDANAKKRELDIIGQLLNIPAKKYLSFVETAQKFIAENRRFIKANESKNDGVVALLFRNMHTIKGNCRTFGFSYISDAAHQTESVYSNMKNGGTADWQPSQMLTDLDTVEGVLNEYQAVYHNVLGRGDSAGAARDQSGFWADEQAITTIETCLQAVEQSYPALGSGQQLKPIRRLLERGLSSPLSVMLTDVVESLPSIAEQLQKAPPLVKIEDGEVRIKNSSEALIGNIFAHLLRNCLDHGIELPEVRRQKGKAEQGTISVIASAQDERLRIHVSDDGQGLNLSRLYKKGLESGLWSAQNPPKAHQVAELIFASGVSTKEQVTDISGRGVGMDAVKQFLLESGGDIELNLIKADDIDPQGQSMAVFELVVILPQGSFMLDDADGAETAVPPVRVKAAVR